MFLSFQRCLHLDFPRLSHALLVSQQNLIRSLHTFLPLSLLLPGPQQNPVHSRQIFPHQPHLLIDQLQIHPIHWNHHHRHRIVVKVNQCHQLLQQNKFHCHQFLHHWFLSVLFQFHHLVHLKSHQTFPYPLYFLHTHPFLAEMLILSRTVSILILLVILFEPIENWVNHDYCLRLFAH